MDPESSQSRRRIPAVTDVVAELAKRLLATPDQQPALFHAAQQVCAEELRLVKTGFGPAGFDELVERAIRLLPAELVGDSHRWSEIDAFSEGEPFHDSGSAPSPPILPRPGSGLEEGPFTLESYEAPAPAPAPEPVSPPAQSVRRLEIPEVPQPTVSPVIRPYGESRPEAAAPKSSISTTRAAIFLVILAIGGVTYWAVRRGAGWFSPKPGQPNPLAAAARSGTPKPGSAGATAPSAAKASSAAVSLASPRSSSESASIAAPPRATAPATPATTGVPETPPSAAAAPSASRIPESKGSAMISDDWNGRTATFMIHFSSYQKRENAERDQARLAKLVGRPFHIVLVNLGREGEWYRVMLGDFPTRDEALAFRQQLADRGTPGMGLVYRVSGAR